MKISASIHQDEVWNYRVRIEGSFKGIRFVYEDPENDPSGYYRPHENDPSYYWWKEGNMGCDCNRNRFLPADNKKFIESEDGSTAVCGCEIIFYKLIPLEGAAVIPIIIFDEDE